jgi:hypothetical protein
MENAKQERPIRIDQLDFPEDVREVRLVPANPPLGLRIPIKLYPKIFPLPWWKRWHHRFWWYPKYAKKDCCCCCANQAAPAPDTPTIDLRLGTLPIGSQFYLLITPAGNRCQFVVAWTARGGVGQLSVDLDVRDPGSQTFRRLATGLGPTDRYTFTGNRATYLFRATVTDARGQSFFNTLTVTCP